MAATRSPQEVITPAGVQRGKDAIRQAFTKLLGEVPQATWDVKTTIFEDDILLLEWGAEGGGNRIEDGIDTFVFRDGLIRVQTVRYTLQSAPERRGMAMRQDIEFDAEGVTLRGWLYLPDGVTGPVPTVVMAHGFSAVKEMFLDSFAEAFAAGGLGALVFDNRNFGASDGEPRQEIDPWMQVRDYRHAITYAQTRQEVDADRIGVWGSSYSGGHVLVLGAIDKRIKCVACQVPLVSGFRNIQRLVRQDFLAPNRTAMDQDRAARYRGEPPAMVPVVDPDPLAVSALPTPDSWEWFSEAGKGRAQAWINEVTLRSVEMLMEYEPSAYLERISPTPMLMVVAALDHLTPTDLALEAYQRAREPKKLVLLPGGHFDAYVKDFETASGAARDWFLEHLGSSGQVSRLPLPRQQDGALGGGGQDGADR